MNGKGPKIARGSQAAHRSKRPALPPVELEIVAPSARPQDPGNRLRRHRHPIGRALGFQLLAGLFLDQEIDQFQPLGLVDRIHQQFPVSMVVVARVLSRHHTPRYARPAKTVLIGRRVGATGLRGYPGIPCI